MPQSEPRAGLKRAISVRDLLVEAGLAASTIEVISHGEADLLVKTAEQHPRAPQPPCRDHGEVTARVPRAHGRTRQPPSGLSVRRRSRADHGCARRLSTPVSRPPRRLGVRHPAAIDPHERRPASRVVIVDVDDRSLSTIGQWPWRRDVVGRLITRLRDVGATAIALDIIFAEPDRYGQPGGSGETPGEATRRRLMQRWPERFARAASSSATG